MDSPLKNTAITPLLLGKEENSLRDAFGKALVNLGVRFPNFVVLDGDLSGGTGTHYFKKEFPSRFFQFGIAEQNMMAAAAGIARTGLIPIVATFGVFSLRAYEQVMLSIAYPALNVKIVGSHPGVDAGPDGASAQAIEDIAAFRVLPGLTVISPADSLEIVQATEALLLFSGPVYMRTGRSPVPRILPSNYMFELGKGKVLVEGSDATIFACGIEVGRALVAAELLKNQGISVRIVNFSTIKPIDIEMIVACAQDTGAFVTAEDHNIIGGLGGAIAETVAKTIPVPIEFVGINDIFGESGDSELLAQKYGLMPNHIVDATKKVIARKHKHLYK